MSSGFVTANYLRVQENIIPQAIFIHSILYGKASFPKLFSAIFFLNSSAGYISSDLARTDHLRA